MEKIGAVKGLKRSAAIEAIKAGLNILFRRKKEPDG